MSATEANRPDSSSRCLSVVLLSVVPLCALWGSGTALATERGVEPELETAEEALDPLDDDRLWDANAATRPNDGTLQFLDPAEENGFHEHHNRVTIDANSLETGWVRMHQCHSGLGPIGNGAIVFHREDTRNLAVESATQVGEHRVDDHRVLVRDVEPDGEICITNEARILDSTENGYELRNGPFLRRFLDGYFPMRVTLDIDWGTLPLTYRGIEPGDPSQAVNSRASGVAIVTAFEGELRTRVQLDAPPSPER